jgi:cellulose synthase/poly-beta-1,6-N-acetylglucosamine synthase-like glycosyltransferase
MLSIIIAAFKEPTISRAIAAILCQNIKEKYELIVAAPDTETKATVNNFARKHKQVKYFQDPGKGKSYALNLLFKKAKGDILVFTDGDVYLDKDAINKLTEPFRHSDIGVVTGRPMPTNVKSNIFGYWSHLLCDAGAHAVREELSKNGCFLECSAYLMAVRSGIINKIPLDVAEDAIIPYYFYKRGFKIAYTPEAKVFVKYPDNFSDWLKQKIRTAKAHETLLKHVHDFPKVKSFSNEVMFGWHRALKYSKNIKELFWTLLLFPARLWVWANVVIEIKLLNKQYTDAWERIESTKS